MIAPEDIQGSFLMLAAVVNAARTRGVSNEVLEIAENLAMNCAMGVWKVGVADQLADAMEKLHMEENNAGYGRLDKNSSVRTRPQCLEGQTPRRSC